MLGFAMCICILIVSVAAPFAFSDTSERVHQHREAQPKEECTHEKETFCTHLPLIEIDIGDQEVPGDVIYNENRQVVGYTTAADGEDTIPATIRVRCVCSRRTEKIIRCQCLGWMPTLSGRCMDLIWTKR